MKKVKGFLWIVLLAVACYFGYTYFFPTKEAPKGIREVPVEMSAIAEFVKQEVAIVR